MDVVALFNYLTSCCSGNPHTKQPNLVTVAVDKIQQSNELRADDNLVLYGQIAYTGNSSMDILMKIFREQDVTCDDMNGKDNHDDVVVEKGRRVRESMPEVLDGDNSGAILTSVYTFVARDGRGNNDDNDDDDQDDVEHYYL